MVPPTQEQSNLLKVLLGVTLAVLLAVPFGASCATWREQETRRNCMHRHAWLIRNSASTHTHTCPRACIYTCRHPEATARASATAPAQPAQRAGQPRGGGGGGGALRRCLPRAAGQGGASRYG